MDILKRPENLALLASTIIPDRETKAMVVQNLQFNNNLGSYSIQQRVGPKIWDSENINVKLRAVCGIERDLL